MLSFDEIRLSLEAKKLELEELKNAIGYDNLVRKVTELEMKASQNGFWDDIENSQKILQITKQSKDQIEAFDKMVVLREDALALCELALEEKDESALEEIKEMNDDLAEKIEAMRLSTLLTGEYDHNNAIITFHPGEGGTEAQDWAEMLFRMYSMWADQHGFKHSILDYQDGDEAGLKRATLSIEGENAYGYLKSEHGVHRLVRVSPFDASGRRHTSFASLEVMPELDDSIKVDIRPEDIKMDVFRSSGAGGQHINKTSSAVRLTHLPTGIVVSCQTERSQFQNKDTCMKMLKAKLMQIKEREHLDKIEDIKGVQNVIAWGSQIRSYVFMPYQMVKDHRTEFEVSDIDGVMNGNIDGFINAFLKSNNKE